MESVWNGIWNKTGKYNDYDMSLILHLDSQFGVSV